jgi:hypothetical protein
MSGGLSVPEPPNDVKDLVEGGIRHRGFEAIAFYKSKRFLLQRPFPGMWGVFYLNEGLNVLALQIQQYYPGFRDPRALARNFLRAHEHCHFRADIQTLMFEAVTGKHLYVPARRKFRGKRSSFVEEAIANRQVYEWANGRTVGITEFAHDFMMLQPDAYGRFMEPIEDLTAEWASIVVDGTPSGSTPRCDLAAWVVNTPKEFMRPSLCPEYVVFPKRLEHWIDPVCILPPVKVIEDDQKVIKLLNGKLQNLRQPWEETKRKLLDAKELRGLNFKPWSTDGKSAYSVRVDHGNRAHLRNQGNGHWLTYLIGSHKELGHG